MANTLPPLTQAQIKWNQRASIARSAGVPDAAINALRNYDIARIQQGDYPLSDQEVEAALNAQYYHVPVIQQHQPTGGGPVKSILNILGNIPSDVYQNIQGFIPGMAHLVTHLPSEVGQLGRDLTHPSLQGLSHDPILSLIPGLYDVGQLATPQGRTWMQQHPVSSLLDVLPLGSSAGKAAMAGRAVEAGSAGEALARGSVMRAGLRAGSDSLSSVASSVLRRDVDIRGNFNKRLAHLGLDPLTREQLSRPFNQMTRQARAEMRGIWDHKVEPLIRNLTPEDRRDLFRDATLGGGQARNPAHQHILDTIREWNQALYVRGSERKALYGIVVPGGHEAIYDYGNPVAKLHRQVGRGKESVESAERRLHAAKKRLDDQTDVALGKANKVRRYGESQQAFAERSAEGVDTPELLHAIAPLSEAFTHLNPMEVFDEYLQRIISGELQKSAATSILKSFRELTGEFPRAHLPDQPATGLFASLEDAISRDDIATAKRIVRRIRQIVGRKAWDHFNTTTHIRQFLTEFQDVLTGLKARRAGEQGAFKSLERAKARYDRAVQYLGTRRDNLTRLQGDFNLALANNAPASFMPKIVDNIKSAAIDKVREGNLTVAGMTTAEVFDKIRNQPNEQFLRDLLGDKEYQQLRQSSMRMWLDMAKAGFDPIWIKKTTSDQLERSMFPKPIPDRVLKPSQYKTRILDMSPGMEDIAAGVTAAESELIAEEFTAIFLNHVVNLYGKTKSEILPDYERIAAAHSHRLATHPESEYVNDLIAKEWVRFEPESFGISNRLITAKTGEQLIPKGVARSLGIMKGGYRLWGKDFEGGLFGIHGAYDRALHVFRMSVLTGPRHFVHIAGGGLAFLALRQPIALRQLGRAWQMFNEGKVPNELMGAVTDFKADQIWNFKVGQQVGSMWKAFVTKTGDLHDRYVAFEQKVATVQRAAAYLEAAPKIGHEAALHEAYKTFVELDSMAPMERAIMKQVIPFYPFMRHLFRYLFALPVDHPYRVAILSRFSQQEQADWLSGMPEMYQSYLFLGQPDQNGNVVGVDMKNLNPFRSFYNDFTMAGFISAANPFFTGFLGAMGINVLSATPTLSRTETYNPVSGGLQGVRENPAAAVLEAFIPEANAVNAFLGLSSNMRYLRATNPSGFQRQLMSNLNLPFVTSVVNKPLTEERAAIAQYQAANNAMQEAMQTGHWDYASRFNMVPYQNFVRDEPTLQAYMVSLQKLLAQYGITDPAQVMMQSPIKLPFHLGV